MISLHCKGMSRLSLDNPKECIAAVKYFKRADTLRVVAILILKAAAPEKSLKSAIKDERLACAPPERIRVLRAKRP